MFDKKLRNDRFCHPCFGQCSATTAGRGCLTHVGQFSVSFYRAVSHKPRGLENCQ